MRIAVNTRLLIKDRLEGIGWFTFETLKRITQAHPEHEFIFLFDRPYDKEFIFGSNVKPVIINPPARHPFLWCIWFELSIPKILKKLKCDLFLSPDGYLSLSSKVPSVAVIHDINFHHRPKDLPFLTRKYYQYYFPKFALKAARIATVSSYSKDDICRSYDIDSDKIDVVYNGANSLYVALTEEEKQKTRNILCNGHDYFLFVGSLHPRKNITRLLLAYDEFRKSCLSDARLVIVGAKMFMNKEMERAFHEMVYREDVIFTGRLLPEKLHKVMGSALALAFVPYFEGFGIPILEAMYCDVPVIASNVTSMPEVCGNAALFIDPFSVDSIKDAMIRISKEENLRNSLIEKGQQQRLKFNWEKTAENLWQCMESALKRID